MSRWGWLAWGQCQVFWMLSQYSTQLWLFKYLGPGKAWGHPCKPHLEGAHLPPKTCPVPPFQHWDTWDAPVQEALTISHLQQQNSVWHWIWSHRFLTNELPKQEPMPYHHGSFLCISVSTRKATQILAYTLEKLIRLHYISVPRIGILGCQASHLRKLRYQLASNIEQELQTTPRQTRLLWLGLIGSLSDAMLLWLLCFWRQSRVRVGHLQKCRCSSRALAETHTQNGWLDGGWNAQDD